MPKAPVLKAREAEKILFALGFAAVRQRGSHQQYRYADGRATTVPHHASRDIGLTVDELIAHR